MSKLFDTLEEIEKHAREQPSVPKPVSRRRFARISRVPFLFGVMLLLCVFFGYQYVVIKNGQVVPSVSSIASGTPSGTLARHAPPSPNTPIAEAELYNNLGVTHAKKGQLWQALYHFEKASVLAPHMIEPYINQGVALLGLNLTYPAKRYLQKAARLDPKNKMLQETIKNAQVSQLLTPEVIDALAVGEGQ